MANLGNLYVIKIGEAGSENIVAGQLDATLTQAGVVVDVSNKSSGGYVTTYDGFLAGKGVSFAGNFNRENEVEQNSLIAATESGNQIALLIEAGDGESWQGNWAVTGRSDSSPKDGIVTTSLTIASSGTYTYTPPTVT